MAYPDIESGSIALDPDSRKDLIRLIAEARKTSRGSEPVVYFTTPEHSQDTYVGVFDSDANMVGKPLKIWNRTSTHTNVLDIQKMRDGLSQAVKGKEWSGNKPTMYSKDGEIYTLMINPAHTLMLYENMKGSTISDDDNIHKVLPVSYPDTDSRNVLIDNNTRRELLRILREAKKEGHGVETEVYLTTPAHSSETYIGVYYIDDNVETKVVGKPIRIMNRTSTDSNVHELISGDLLSQALRAINKMDESLGMKNGLITLEYKSDYPLRLSSGNGKISTHALIAPRITEDWREKQINKMMMENIKNNKNI